MVYRRESPYLFSLYRIAQFGNGQPSQVMKLRLTFTQIPLNFTMSLADRQNL